MSARDDFQMLTQRANEFGDENRGALLVLGGLVGLVILWRALR